MNTRILAVSLVLTALTGCQALDRLQTLEDLAQGEGDLGQVIADRVADGITIGMAGLSPSPGYASNGQVDLSLVARDASVDPARLVVQVQNRDGSYSECRHGDGVVVDASPMNAMALLIDGSGSMEVSYYDGTCDTCPHDPNRERVGAAHRFIDTLYDVGPQNRLAVAEFGPEASGGFVATALHADFNDNRRYLWTALDSIGGDLPIGTPLWDSVFEMIEATDAESEVLSREIRADVQRHLIVLSDGQDNASQYHDLQDAVAAAVEHGVRVYVVGLGPASAADTRFDDVNRGIRELQTLAEATGGFYAGVDDPVRLHNLFDTVAYALAGGYERHTYVCVPGDHADDPHPSVASGARVQGRVLDAASREVTSEWAFIAP